VSLTVSLGAAGRSAGGAGRRLGRGGLRLQGYSADSSAVVINTALPKRRSEYNLGIGYGDDIGHACEVVLATLSRLDGVEAEPAPAVLPWSIDPSQVTLKVWWWTRSAQIDVVQTRARIIAAIKRALDAADSIVKFVAAL
jgi:small-conductance mechanosensitive channel